MKNRRLFSRRQSSRFVLFSSKGKAVARKPAVAAGKPAAAGAGQIISAEAGQKKIIDFAALSSWYAEQNALKEVVNEPVSPYAYSEKQRNLRFMML